MVTENNDLLEIAKERSKGVCQLCGGEPAEVAHHPTTGKPETADDILAIGRRCSEIYRLMQEAQGKAMSWFSFRRLFAEALKRNKNDTLSMTRDQQVAAFALALEMRERAYETGGSDNFDVKEWTDLLAQFCELSEKFADAYSDPEYRVHKIRPRLAR